MKRSFAVALAAVCLVARANTVFILPPEQLHFPVRPEETAYILKEGDAFARAARLAHARPVGAFELRVWTQSTRSGEGEAYVLAKNRIATYAITRRDGRLGVVRTSSRKFAASPALVSTLRAAHDAFGRPGCDVSDAGSATVEASLDGTLVAFSGIDEHGLCQDEPTMRMAILLRDVRAAAGR
jgi:hypothetical protein